MTAIKFKLTLKNMLIIVSLCIFLKFYVLIKGSPLNANYVQKREQVLKVQLQGEDIDDSKDPDFAKFEKANKVMHGPKMGANIANPVNVGNVRRGGGRGEKESVNKRSADINKSMNKIRIEKNENINIVNKDLKEVDGNNYLQNDEQHEVGKGYELKNKKSGLLNKKKKKAINEANKIQMDMDDNNEIEEMGEDDYKQNNARNEEGQGNNLKINKKVDLINKQQNKRNVIHKQNNARNKAGLDNNFKINKKVDLINKQQNKRKIINEEREIKGDKYVDIKKNAEEKQVFVKDGRNWEIMKKDGDIESNGKETGELFDKMIINEDIKLNINQNENVNKIRNMKPEGKGENSFVKKALKSEEENLVHQNVKPEIKNKKENMKPGNKSEKDEKAKYEGINEERNEKKVKKEQVKSELENKKKGGKAERKDLEHKNDIKGIKEFRKNEWIKPERKENMTNNFKIKQVNQDHVKLDSKQEMASLNLSHHINLAIKRINEVDSSKDDIVEKIEGLNDVNMIEDEEVLESLNDNEMVLEHQMAGIQKDRVQIKSVLNKPKKKGEFRHDRNGRKNNNGNLRKRIGIDSVQKIENNKE